MTWLPADEEWCGLKAARIEHAICEQLRASRRHVRSIEEDSKRELQGKLNHARQIVCVQSTDLSERRTRKRRIRIGQVDIVEEIECFSPELQIQILHEC